MTCMNETPVYSVQQQSPNNNVFVGAHSSFLAPCIAPTVGEKQLLPLRSCTEAFGEYYYHRNTVKQMTFDSGTTPESASGDR